MTGVISVISLCVSPGVWLLSPNGVVSVIARCLQSESRL